MKLPLVIIAVSACRSVLVNGFAFPSPLSSSSRARAHIETRGGFGHLKAEVSAEDSSSGTTKAKERQTLGLLTFDLDDTLYPIDKVVAEANGKPTLKVRTNPDL